MQMKAMSLATVIWVIQYSGLDLHLLKKLGDNKNASPS